MNHFAASYMHKVPTMSQYVMEYCMPNNIMPCQGYILLLGIIVFFSFFFAEKLQAIFVKPWCRFTRRRYGANSTSLSQVPLIDIGAAIQGECIDRVSKEICSAANKFGAFQVINHGINTYKVHEWFVQLVRCCISLSVCFVYIIKVKY